MVAALPSPQTMGMIINSPDRKESKIASFKAMLSRIMDNIIGFAMRIKKIGEDDPRRVVHSMKVGLALSLVSLFYYFRPLYDGFGPAGMWAVLTVVVVFEYTVGGTISKCSNRGLATLVAGALGVGAEYLAALCGKQAEPIMLGLFVFVLAAISSFTRFIPSVKRRFDYGVLIFILTFSLVAVSGYRVDQILQLAHQRLSTILIGAGTCMVISIFCCPVWAGQDLHNMVAANIEKIAAFLEGFGDEFFNSQVDESSKVPSKIDGNKSFLESYKSLLNSKATEDSLANFAWWEPGHGRFRYNHPWKQYLKTGSLARECACHIETLNGLLKTKSKVKITSELEKRIQRACRTLSLESAMALRGLASSIRTMTFPSQAVANHIQNSKAAADELTDILESCPLPSKSDLQEFLPILVTASVLIDNIGCVEKISASVHELSQKARFEKPKGTDPTEKGQRRGVVKPVNDVDDCVVVVIEVPEISGDSPENCKSDHSAHHQADQGQNKSPK